MKTNCMRANKTVQVGKGVVCVWISNIDAELILTKLILLFLLIYRTEADKLKKT